VAGIVPIGIVPLPVAAIPTRLLTTVDVTSTTTFTDATLATPTSATFANVCVGGHVEAIGTLSSGVLAATAVTILPPISFAPGHGNRRVRLTETRTTGATVSPQRIAPVRHGRRSS